MKTAGPVLPPNSLLVVTAKWRPAGPGSPSLSLSPGRTVHFEVMPATAAGEARIRIDGHVLSASVARPLQEGATGTAVVKRPGPPIVLQLTELSPPPPRDLLKIPVLMGREPLRSGPFPPSALERWNDALLRLYPPDLQTLSPDAVRDGILLVRFLSAALAAGNAAGEKPAASPKGARRTEGSAPAPDPADAMEKVSGTEEGETAPAAAGREAPPRDDVPFWFFLPTPGGTSPFVFPGHRRREGREKEPSWGIFLRLPGLGAVSVRFVRVDAGWRIGLGVEDERLFRAVSKGAGELGDLLRAKGFPLRGVTVAPAPKGRIDAETAARMSVDMGLPLLERRA